MFSTRIANYSNCVIFRSKKYTIKQIKEAQRANQTPAALVEQHTVCMHDILCNLNNTNIENG
jgi:hypothetical protein